MPVYPIAIFTYTKPPRAEPAEYRVKFPDLEVLRFRYRTVQLNRLNWRKFVRSKNPIASALMARMRIAEEDRPKVKLHCLRLLVTLKLNPAKQQMISGFVDTYLGLNQQELVVFEKEIGKLANEEEQEVLKITTSWEEKGIIIGEIKGLREGLEPALRLRFGDEGMAFLASLPEGVEVQTLKRIAEAVLSAPDLAALRRVVSEKPGS